MQNCIFFSNICLDLFEIFLFTTIGVLFIVLVNLIFNTYLKRASEEKLTFKLVRFINKILTMFVVLTIFIMWIKCIKGFILSLLIISFLFRDFVIEFMFGLHLKKEKFINKGDLININGQIGMVLSLDYFSLKLQEIDENADNYLLTGNIVRIPNSQTLKSSVVSMSKDFRYMWTALDIRIPLNEDVGKSKKVLFEIINNVDLIKNTIKKAKNDLEKSELGSNIGSVEPTIFTKVDEDYALLSMRFLVDPKKLHYVKSLVYSKIIEANNKGELALLQKR